MRCERFCFLLLLVALAAACSANAPETTDDTEANPVAHWPLVPQRGDTMAPFRFVAIVAPGDPDQDDVFAFDDALPTSAWWKAVSSEYGLGPVASHSNLVGARPMTAASMGDDDILQYIEDTLAANAGDPNARVDEHTLFLLYMPQGTHSTDAATGEVNVNCGLTSGFHTYDPKTHLVWGIVERCPPAYGWTPLQEATQTASHEIAESATDPWIDPARPGWSLACDTPDEPWKCSPFAIATQGEIGDLCPETRWDEAGFVFTRVFSNTAARAGGDPCVPALATPYYGARTGSTWYALDAGTTTAIDVTAWSPGDAPAWVVSAGIAMTSSGAAIAAQMEPRTMESGETAKVVVTVPASAKHGDWAVLFLASDPVSNSSGDPEHDSWFGVYVP